MLLFSTLFKYTQTGVTAPWVKLCLCYVFHIPTMTYSSSLCFQTHSLYFPPTVWRTKFYTHKNKLKKKLHICFVFLVDLSKLKTNKPQFLGTPAFRNEPQTYFSPAGSLPRNHIKPIATICRLIQINIRTSHASACCTIMQNHTLC
jgi:hypothetical protein